MADEEVLPPPLEIPWKLASTTQPLSAGEPDETAIALFTFEPDDEEITGRFPDQRLVYLKFTTSISPAAFPANIPPVAGAALGEGVPCFFVQLDLKVRNPSGAVGTIRPYFHAAAPLHRRMIQTGVVGSEIYEGEADGQFMGKSGSQMYETSSSRSRTTSLGASAGIGIGPVSIGGSARRTSTDVSAERAVSQVVDTTSREASQERRELVSHHTRIENVLTLLNAKYVGTPHLRYSLSPQPLQLLSLDPADPNLWYTQLLARRSSGIEGVQEFTAVVLVPRDENFCVNARLRRVCVLDNPPGPFTLDDPFNFNTDLVRALVYLDRVYPPGTPLEEFDVDLIGALPTPDDFTRPVLEQWVIAGSGLMLVDVVSPTPLPFAGSVKRATINYKHLLEIWLETLRDEYDREVQRSPLERGVLLGEERVLDTCFTFAAAGGPAVSGSSASVTPLFPIDIDPGEFDLGGVTATASSARAAARERAWESVTRWNLLENRLATLLANRRTLGKRPLGLDDPRIVDAFIEAWAGLRAGDPRNLDFAAATKALHLGEAHRRALKAAGASDLRGIARAIKHAPDIDRYNERLRQRRALHKGERAKAAAAADPVKLALSVREAAEMRKAIGAGLAGEMAKGSSRK
ncbi:MAG: hypothetical protein NFCOHLIN_01918 [Gammaproteobacteria bacterium]|nr:hypothetical protein [Gammaproteobacteria bacterium]